MYHITITKFEKRSQEEIDEIKKNRNWNGGMEDYPKYVNELSRNEFEQRNVLNVAISDEEFKVIKKAVVEIM